jgi:phosphatidylserine/phosphatidylglycerophosphate/cardiolipin synthase-like enzyme
MEVFELEAVTLTGTVLIGASLAYALYLIPTKVKEKEAGLLSSVKQDEIFDNTNIRYMFTKKGNSIKRSIINLIDDTRNTLDVAAFSLTEKDIIEHLCFANQRGVKIRVLTDKEQSSNKYQNEAVNRLINKGIPVKTNCHSGRMHLKMIISDENSVIAGSYNLSKNAETKNDEVMIFLDNRKIGSEWTDNFNDMWNDKLNFQDFYKEEFKKYA